MAEILLARFGILTDRGSGFTPGKFVESYWDDVAFEIKSYLKDNRNDPPGTPLVSGPDLGDVGWRGRSHSYDSFLEYPQNNVAIPYSFCDSTTLNSFRWKSTFPYTLRVETENHFYCVSIVCDIQITNYVVSDDSISVEATSSNGEIRYSLDPNFQYSSGQTSGVFTGLFAGTYTVTAMDELNCIAQIELVIGASIEYGVRYRLDFKSVKGILCRLDIEQRAYEGDIIEICAGSHNPIFINGNNEGKINRFDPILPCEIQATILSETNFYFLDLFNADDRKYRLKYYEDRGNEVPPSPPADNINITGDEGQYESDRSTWGFADVYSTITRSSDESTSGTYSAKIEKTDVSNDFLIPCAFFGVIGERYTITAKVFVPVVNPVASDASDILITGRNIDNVLFGVSEVSQITKTVAEAKGTWVQVELVLEVTGPSSLSNLYFANIRCSGSLNLNGVIYVDQLEIRQSVDEIGGPLGYELKAAGYSISQNYKEDYRQPPYPVTIVAVDCLADLKNYEFKDQSENIYQNIDYTLLSLIVDILAKTDLRLNICMAVNKYEQDMDTDLDPFVQVTINPRIFDGKNCFDVLSEILKPFGARIVLRNGEWLIYCIEQQVTDVNFRRFNYQGQLIEEGIYFDLVSVLNPDSTAWFRRDNAVLEQIFAYGVFDLNYSLIQNNSLLKAYSFEEEDLINYPDGTAAFNGWNVNISEDDGATYGIKETNSFEGKWNFFYKKGTETDDAIDSLFVTVTAQTGIIEYDVTDALKISIDLAAIATGNRLYHAHFQWSLKIGDYYYNAADGEWTTDADYKYNNVFIKTFNEKQTVETVINFRDVEELTVEDFVFEMKLNREQNVAFSTTSNDPGVYEPLLSAIETVKLPLGYLITGRTNGTSASGRYRVYELVDGPAEGDQVEPDDYDEDDNNKVWSEVSVMGRRSQISYWYVDNVRLVHLPGGTDAPQTITTEKINNTNFKNNFEETYLLNDIDIENINNSERTYRNFFKLLDGSPTQVWSRTWRAGQGKLLDLLADELASQYKRTSYKITSPFGVSIDGEVWPSTVLKDEFDNDRKYMFMGYSRDALNDEITADVHEIVDVTDDESEDIDAGFTTGFSLGYRA